MIEDGESCDRDLSGLVVPSVGRLIATGDRYEPYRMLGPDKARVEPVTAFFRDLLAAGRAEATVRSYGMDLLRWFRFLVKPADLLVDLGGERGFSQGSS